MSAQYQGQRAVITAPYRVEVQSYDVPVPGQGQIVIQTEASAISAGTELAIYTGIHQWLSDPNRMWPKFPCVPGYSAVGRVVARGEGITGFSEGDRVIWPGRHDSFGVANVGGKNPLVRHIAEDLPAQVAACAALTRFPLTALIRSREILGQSVAVFGLGAIGQLTLRLFSAAGAYPLYGIDPVTSRHAWAEATPGVTALDPAGVELREELRRLNGGASPDIVVDATGAPEAVKDAMHVVADGGKVVMVGSPRGIASNVDFYWDLHGRSIQLIGAHGSSVGVEAREKFPYVLDRAMDLIVHLLESGKLRIDDLVTHYEYASKLGDMYEGLLHDKERFLAVTLHW